MSSLPPTPPHHHHLQEELLGDVRSLHGGLIHKALHDPEKAAHKHALLKLISQALGLTKVTENQRKDQQGLKEMEVCLLILASWSQGLHLHS